jgi:CO/xanthine dehydrogenase Mo-binding subunit
MDAVIQSCAEKSGWNTDQGSKQRTNTLPKIKPYIKKGRGFACSFKNVGFSFGAPEQCTAKIELIGKDTIDRVRLYHSGADVGQGAHTAFIQMAAEATGVDFDQVHLIASDTAFTENSGSSSASRLTFMAGNSIRGAAAKALEKWKNEERPAVATYQYRPPKTSPYDPETGKCEPNFAYGYVAESVEIEVDVETGDIRILNVTCVDDVGRAINPEQVRGQIEGAIIQAAGYAIQENFIQKDGYVLTPKLSQYLIPTVMDIPERVESVIYENPDPIGPFGARGMGEMPFLPFVPALTAALHDATGIWFNEFPLTPERVLKGLGKL